jgi:L-ascorbate metabolism protein UlaG (beta-lactamase superfamily)
MVDGAVAARRTGRTADRIVFLGHATVLIEVDGVRLLTDPLLRGRVAHLRRQVPPVQQSLFADVDAVLISHLHHDHLDLASLRLLGGDTPLVVPAGAGGWLRHKGFGTVTELKVGGVAQVGAATEPGVGGVAQVGTVAEPGVGVVAQGGTVTELAAGDVAEAGTLTVTAVQARHDGRRLGGPRAETLGYLVSGGHTVYFAGDTELFAEMSHLPRPLDAALLPVAGWGPTLGAGHMGPLDAARAVGLIEPRIAIPVHWGTLSPLGLGRRDRARLGDPPRLFAEHMAKLAPRVEVRILAPGQEADL